MNPPLLLLIAVLVSLSGLSAQGQKTVPEMVDSVEGAAESAAGPKAKAADVLTPKAGQVKVRGLVEDAEGRPLAGARLILGSGETLDAQAALDTPVGVADAEGKFELHLQAHADAQAAKQHAYLLAVAPGLVAVRVRMPTLRYTTDVSWGAAKNAVQERALQGLDLMARLWGRKTQRKPAGVDLKRIVLCRGVVLRGLVTDALNRFA